MFFLFHETCECNYDIDELSFCFVEAESKEEACTSMNATPYGRNYELFLSSSAPISMSETDTTYNVTTRGRLAKEYASDTSIRNAISSKYGSKYGYIDRILLSTGNAMFYFAGEGSSAVVSVTDEHGIHYETGLEYKSPEGFSSFIARLKVAVENKILETMQD